VPPDDTTNKVSDSSRAPRVGLILMVAIVVGTGLIALYANVQKARRDTIEKVTITPISSTPIASASPAFQP
jgi:threonine dehydrogenase-like Zn-dependent dehydrogenase